MKIVYNNKIYVIIRNMIAKNIVLDLIYFLKHNFNNNNNDVVSNILLYVTSYNLLTSIKSVCIVSLQFLCNLILEFFIIFYCFI